jgi:hypothetical protein
MLEAELMHGMSKKQLIQWRIQEGRGLGGLIVILSFLL